MQKMYDSQCGEWAIAGDSVIGTCAHKQTRRSDFAICCETATPRLGV